MLADLARFYRQAPRDARHIHEDHLTLSEYLAAGRYGEAFRDCHIVPLASAIWSATPAEIMAFPAAAFIRFHDNHGLLQFSAGRSGAPSPAEAREYVSRMGLSLAGSIRYGTGAGGSSAIRWARPSSTPTASRDRFDHVVLACHADEALALIDEPDSRRARAARRLPLQPQPRGPPHRRQPHAAPPRGLGELELHRAATGARATVSASPTG